MQAGLVAAITKVHLQGRWQTPREPREAGGKQQRLGIEHGNFSNQ
jgi:hypothetical protein